jgi:GTP-binding protein
MFVDWLKIYVKGGDGGRGCISFHREKFAPRGGPDGGDGGNGGSVYLKSRGDLDNLSHLADKLRYKAGKGGAGSGNNRTGKKAEDLLLPVPIGTMVFDEEKGELIHDFVNPDEFILVARGGRGGKGNARFATPTNQAPHYAEPGEKGEERWLIVELKLIADVGLVGFPNSGKSTLISRISAARPKIAAYPFTTLSPNLGVVELPDYQRFTVADIPGLIEGAHKGTGLGHQFLRHVERTKLLVHLVDVSRADPAEVMQRVKTINEELKRYNDQLPRKVKLIVGNKIDLVGDRGRIDDVAVALRNSGYETLFISSLTGEGVPQLVNRFTELLLATVKED